jgi:flavin reductase (DIM6/NTAB) family NADH-FMN oxidoreductase RutF
MRRRVTFWRTAVHGPNPNGDLTDRPRFSEVRLMRRMKLDLATLPAGDSYRMLVGLVTPRPIAWVSTVSRAGIVNLAPYSFFNAVGVKPPALVFSVSNRRDGSKKDTLLNVEARGELVVNLVSYDQREAMNACGEELPPDVSELERCGLVAVPSEHVLPPRVAGARAAFECLLHQVVPVGEGPHGANLVIARIVFCHIEDAVLDAGGGVNDGALDTIGRMGGDGYVRTTDRFSLPRAKSRAR